MVSFICFASICIPVAAESLLQCLTIVIPSIFPFLVLTEMLSKTDFFNIVGNKTDTFSKKVFKVTGTAFSIVFLGYLCGFPGAAKLSTDLYKDKKISYEDTVRLSLFVNNPGPLFIIGTIGIGILDSMKVGIMLLIVQIVSSLITGLILNNFIKIKSIKVSHENRLSNSLQRQKCLNIIIDAITNAFYTMIPITGTIVFFSFFSEVVVSIKEILPLHHIHNNFEYNGLINASIKCFFELSNGLSSIIPEISSTALFLPILSLICAWSGISIHIQIINFYIKAKVPIRYYLIGKIFNMILAFIIMCFVITFFA